ncbi:hypothetical protein BDW74DRAFT_171554 [Aspergillus multicolor]|uniref:uncharacterized protein n=1 Tax=Aspergillus multicolor TaxID=41759 RepID=UPI003CCD50C0
MLPTFHINSFKPWAPPSAKPFSQHRIPSICSPRTQNFPHPKPTHVLPPSTLPLPKHHLPARPPAEVCMNVSASSQPCTPSSPQTQVWEISRLESEESSFPEISEYDTASSNSVPYVPAADPSHRCNPQDDTEIPAEPRAFRGDYTARGLSSPSISSSNNSIKEFLRLPDAQDDNIPIDPVILADLGGWEDIDLQQHAPQADSLITTEKACPYPDPPTILYNPINHSRAPDEKVGGEVGDTQASDRDHLPTNSDQQVHPFPHSANPKPCFLKGVHGNNRVVKPRSRKRKIQQSDSPDPKRLRARSPLPLREDPSTALQSQLTSLPLDDRLQFLSWLFEGALSRCMPGTTCPEMEQNPVVCRGVQRRSRKGMPWSAEEADLLVKLRKDEGRTWSEVVRLFSKEYPGRSQGAIQVFWSTTLNQKAG